MDFKAFKQAYMEEVEKGFVDRKIHPEDPNVVILNYTPEVVYARGWTAASLQCRGIIANELTEELLARPFAKFFNYGENAGFDQEEPQGEPEITVKQDGSLGILYRLNGKIRWATRGSFISEQSKAAQAIWDAKYADAKVPDNLTLLCEIIHPCSRVVVNYDFQDLVIIGAIDRFTGEDFDYAKLKELADSLGMRITEKVEGDLESMLEKAKTLIHNEEGFVLRWKDGLRLKVKGQEYMKVHKVLYGLSEKQKLEYWLEGRTQELVRLLPEEFREEIESREREWDKLENEIANRAKAAFGKAPKGSKKEFALWVTGSELPDKTLLFLMFDGRIQASDVRKAAFEQIRKAMKEEREAAPM